MSWVLIGFALCVLYGLLSMGLTWLADRENRKSGK